MQFGAIIFCRTFEELFWSVRVDWEKATSIVAFHFMKRRLKIGSFAPHMALQSGSAFMSLFSRRLSSEKSPTITVASFFSSFFVKPQTSPCMYNFLVQALLSLR